MRKAKLSHSGNLTALAIILFFLIVSGQAQTPQEQLSQLVTQLQKTPTDNALRERIIKLAASMKPAPTVPDEGIRFEGRGQYAFKAAKTEADYLTAAQEYEKAVAAAPWVLGYYSDLCTIYDKAGKPADAKRNCSFYLIGLTDADQITDAKRRIAGLEFGIEKAATDAVKARQEKADADKAAAIEAAKPHFAGFWVQSGDITGSGAMNSAIKIGEDLPSLGNVGFGYNVNDNPPLAPTIDPSTSISNLETNGRQIRFRVTNEFIRGYFDFSLTLSDDGSRLTGNWIFTQYDTSRGLGFFAQRGRVPVVYLRAN